MLFFPFSLYLSIFLAECRTIYECQIDHGIRPRGHIKRQNCPVLSSIETILLSIIDIFHTEDLSPLIRCTSHQSKPIPPSTMQLLQVVALCMSIAATSVHSAAVPGTVVGITPRDAYVTEADLQLRQLEKRDLPPCGKKWVTPGGQDPPQNVIDDAGYCMSHSCPKYKKGWKHEICGYRYENCIRLVFCLPDLSSIHPSIHPSASFNPLLLLLLLLPC